MSFYYGISRTHWLLPPLGVLIVIAGVWLLTRQIRHLRRKLRGQPVFDHADDPSDPWFWSVTPLKLLLGIWLVTVGVRIAALLWTQPNPWVEQSQGTTPVPSFRDDSPARDDLREPKRHRERFDEAR